MYNKDELDNESIQQLWDSFRKGDQTSFSKIYTLYQNNLFNYGLRIIDDVEVVKDVVQDVFIEVWSKREKVEKVKSLKYYLLVILKRRLIDRIRKQSSQSLESKADLPYAFTLELSIESNIILAETLKHQEDAIVNAMEILSNREKEIIYLRFYDELSFDEISGLLNISKKTTYNLLHSAINKLRKRLNPPLFFLFFFQTFPNVPSSFLD